MAFQPRKNLKGFAIGAAITVLWLVMMGSLVWRHVLPHQKAQLEESSIEDPSTLTRRWQDTKEFMLLKSGPAVIGAASTVVQRVNDSNPRYVADFRLGATFGFARLKQQIAVKAQGELDSRFELTTLALDSNLAGFVMRVRGATRGTELFLDVEKNGQHSLSRIQLGRRISLLEAVRPALLKRFAIRPGATYVLPVVDPTFSMQQGEVEMRVLQREQIELGGKQVEAYKIEMRLNDFVSYSWVDKQGSTLRRQVIGKLIMERGAEQEAKKISPVLTEGITVQPLDVTQFKQVKSQTVEQLSDGKQSPLSVLGTVLQSQ